MAVDLAGPWQRTGPVYGDPRLAPQRLGQQAFQAVVLRAYQRRCAVTGDRIRPVLQAAHIRPLPAGGEHRLDNGLLLRSDVHTLYDRGYLGVDPQYRLLVSPRLRDEFGNGEQFYAHAGERIALPQRQGDLASPFFTAPHQKYTINFTGAPEGTYDFFCLPHQALGMKGTIIVGHPGGPGSTINDGEPTPAQVPPASD